MCGFIGLVKMHIHDTNLIGWGSLYMLSLYYLSCRAMIMNICVMITALFYNNCYTVERNEGQKWFQSVKTLATAHMNGGYVPCLTLYAITYIIIKCWSYILDFTYLVCSPILTLTEFFLRAVHIFFTGRPKDDKRCKGAIGWRKEQFI